MTDSQRQTKMRATILGVLVVAAVVACAEGGATDANQDRKSAGSPVEASDPVAGRALDDPQHGMAARQDWQRYTFDSDAVGSAPSGFTPVHSGDGKPGEWQVVEAPDAPSPQQAVAQLDADSTGQRFPLLVLDSVVARDLDLEVVGKPISGRKDQAIGLIWRYRDADNYYVLRANALEDNVVLYKMEAGKRSDLDLKGRGRTYGLDVEVPLESWSRLRVNVRGNLFTAFLDGRELFQVEDDTFTGPGQVGLWTKADSVTWFDDFAVRALDTAAATESEPEQDE